VEGHVAALAPEVMRAAALAGVAAAALQQADVVTAQVRAARGTCAG